MAGLVGDSGGPATETRDRLAGLVGDSGGAATEARADDRVRIMGVVGTSIDSERFVPEIGRAHV